MANEIEDVKEVKTGEDNQSGTSTDKTVASGNGEGNSDKKPTAVEELQALKDATDALARDKQKLIDDIAVLRGERREARAGNPQGAVQEKQEAKPTESVVEEKPPEDYEGWKKLISKSSDDAAKKVVSTELTAIKDSQRKKAYRKFIEEYPEYSPANDPEDKKFSSLMETYKRVQSRTDMDAEDILEDLQDSYAVLHRSEIFEKAKKAKQVSIDQEQSTADIAASSPSSGERDITESVVLTPSETRIYKEVLKNSPDMTPQTFKKRLKEQE